MRGAFLEVEEIPTSGNTGQKWGTRSMIFAIASTMARDGSSGVEKTFNIWSCLVLGSIQMQSVKVPPVSMAMRRGWRRRGISSGR